MLENVYAGVATTFTGGVGWSNLSQVFAFVLNLVVGVGWALVFIMLALGFVQYIMSKGEKTAVDNAQKWLTYAVIGGVGLFFITFVRNVIPQLLGTTNGPYTGGGNISPL